MFDNDNFDILKVDLDVDSITEVFLILVERLRYLHYYKILDVNNIKTINTIFKSRYGVKIYLHKKISADHIIIFQLLLGSDWKKEAHTFKDYHIERLAYWNRMFSTKRYIGNTYKVAKIEDITDIILSSVKNKVFDVKAFKQNIEEIYKNG